jgi:tetratricopeptide (TPR) repeat protein
MRDPTEEPGLLLALEDFLAPCQTLVTFNGKSFDAPLLNTRYTLQGWRSPLKEFAHIDLLHISRRLWRDRLPNRALGSLEVDILGTSRTEQEVPGWMVPQLYFDYLRSGDARPLRGVFYHNLMDVLSMAALLNHIARLLTDPLNPDLLYSQDQAALGRLYEDLGQVDMAAQIYTTSLERDLPPTTYQDVLQRLSMLYKRQGHIDTAMTLWQQAAGLGQVYACVELAKIFEHQRGELGQALTWTETALAIVSDPAFSRIERYQWLPELKHRLERLERKLSGKPPLESDMQAE